MSAFQLPIVPTVLLIDSDSENRDFLRSELEQEKFKVLEAEDLDSALAVILSQKISSVIIDLELSRMEREAFIQRLQSKECGNPVIILLASPSSISWEEAYDLGAASVFSKPIDPQQLIVRLNELLVPASMRWKNKNKSKKSLLAKKLSESSISEIDLGRGGFTIPLKTQDELFEGQSIAFDLDVNGNKSDSWKLSGTGIIRYVKLDKSKRRQKAWGIEFESLDDASLERIIQLQGSKELTSYIPSTLH